MNCKAFRAIGITFIFSTIYAVAVNALRQLSGTSLRWRHNERDGVSNHRRHDCLPNCLFRRRSKKTSKLRVTGHCERNSSVTGELPSQRASNAENVSIGWRHHVETKQAIWQALKDKNCNSASIINYRWISICVVWLQIDYNYTHMFYLAWWKSIFNNAV